MAKRKIRLEITTSDERGEFCSEGCGLIMNNPDEGPQCPFKGTIRFYDFAPRRDEDCIKAEQDYKDHKDD